MKTTLYLVHYDHHKATDMPVITPYKPNPDDGASYAPMLIGSFEVDVPDLTEEEVAKAHMLGITQRQQAKRHYYENCIRDLETNMEGAH